jgi:hypothetical protein
MNYKSVFLGMLIVPFATMGNNIITYKQELEERFLQKQLELSNLGAMIAEKDRLFASLEAESVNVFRSLVDKRAKLLEEKNGGALSETEREQLSSELRKEAIGFAKTFWVDYNDQKKIEGVLVGGLIAEINSFESFKFYLIHWMFEWQFLRGLIAKYERCLEELRVMQNEATKFKNENNTINAND